MKVASLVQKALWIVPIAASSIAMVAPNINAAIHTPEQGSSALVIKNELKVTTDNDELSFQDGKPTTDVQFFASPRCYFRLKKGMKAIPAGTHLKVSKIENSYKNGHGQVVFTFEDNSAINGMSCYTNYDHSISLQELRGILGPAIHVDLPKSAEDTAMNNLAPQRAPLVLAPGNPAISQASW